MHFSDASSFVFKQETERKITDQLAENGLNVS